MAPADSGSPREQLAHWVTSPNNQYFAKSYVNRIWSYLLGVGFIEPVDDIRAGNPADQPGAARPADARVHRAAASTCSSWCKLICKSRVYQHSIATNSWNEDDQINYSHAMARRLPAEVLYDAVYQATGSVRRLPGMPAGSRAAQQRDSTVNLPDGFLDLFGRPPRESACECERSGGVMLGQALNLINGPTIAQAIADAGNGIAKLVASEKDDAKVVEEIFYRVLSRPPTSREIEHSVAALAPRTTRTRSSSRSWPSTKSSSPTSSASGKSTSPSSPGRRWKSPRRSRPSARSSPKKPDGSVFVTRQARKATPIRLIGKTPLARYHGRADRSACRIRGCPASGPGRAPNGNFVLSELKLTARRQGRTEQSTARRAASGDRRFQPGGLAGGQCHRRQSRAPAGR